VYLTIDPTLQKYIDHGDETFAHIMALKGHVYRALEGRCTQRIELGGQGYFLKQHHGVGWKEIVKNILQLRLPIVGAKNEWLALQRLQQLDIPTMQVMAYGEKGFNPARRESFLLTKELTNVISLEDLSRDWLVSPPKPMFKRALIKEVARMVRVIHANGLNHRDCYICHFLWDTTSSANMPRIYLIDLHRAQLRTETPERWVIKDLAGLYFSSKDIGLTSRDLWRFIREYRLQTLGDTLTKERTFWKKVKQRGDKTYQKHGQQ